MNQSQSAPRRRRVATVSAVAQTPSTSKSPWTVIRSPASTAVVTRSTTSAIESKAAGGWDSSAARKARACSGVRYPRRTSVTATGSERPMPSATARTSAYS